MQTDLPIYALQVKTGRERVVERQLSARSIDAYLPVFQVKSQWADRVKILDRPLFPGYLFCPLDLNNRAPALTVTGVIGIVGIGPKPVPVDAAELAAVRRMVEFGKRAEPCDPVEIGEKVEIGAGPLKGMTGLLKQIRGEHRLVVSISLLNRFVSVEIDRSQVLRVGRGAALPCLS